MLHEPFFVIYVPPSIVSGVVRSNYSSSGTSCAPWRRGDRGRDWVTFLYGHLFWYLNVILLHFLCLYFQALKHSHIPLFPFCKMMRAQWLMLQGTYETDENEFINTMWVSSQEQVEFWDEEHKTSCFCWRIFGNEPCTLTSRDDIWRSKRNRNKTIIISGKAKKTYACLLLD